MFLEKTVFYYGFEQAELYELTALQRAEYFECIASLLAESEQNTTEAGKGAALVRLNTESNAWLVSRARWNGNREADVEEIYHQILSDWPEKALSQAAEKVMMLSGLDVDVKAEEQREYETAEGPEVKQSAGS